MNGRGNGVSVWWQKDEKQLVIVIEKKMEEQRNAIKRQDRHDYLQNTGNRYHEWINNINEEERIIFRTRETENRNKEIL